jgi:choice-of-anchor C domain-containing protein
MLRTTSRIGSVLRCTIGIAAAAVLALPASAAAVAAPANLVVNGSFETPAAPVGGFSTYGGGADLGGWEVIGGSIDHVHDSFWSASAGEASIDMIGCGSGGVRQVLATEAGKTYTLSFDLSSNGGAGGSVAVTWGSAVVKNVTVPGGTVPPTYIPSQLEVTATSASTTLAFYSESDACAGPVLDDVRVSSGDGTTPVLTCLQRKALYVAAIAERTAAYQTYMSDRANYRAARDAYYSTKPRGSRTALDELGDTLARSRAAFVEKKAAAKQAQDARCGSTRPV